MADRIALGIMARAPSDAGGKTRLVRALGLHDGTPLRRAILRDTLDRAARASGVERVVLYTPVSARGEIHDLASGVSCLLPQRGESLGERLTYAFADLFERGYAGVAIVGSDLATVPAGYLDKGIEALMRRPDSVVIGPAEDGGYYFIGLRRPHPELFEGVPWSTAEVFAATHAKVVRAGLNLTVMPSWYDIDSVADLERALAPSEEVPASDAARHLRAWAASTTWPAGPQTTQRGPV